MQFLAFITAMLFGIAAAIQAPTNASLARKIGSTQATLVSFTGGLALLCLIVPLFGRGQLFAALDVPKWQLIGGIYAAIAIFGLTRVIPHLGAALSATILVLGELCSSIIIDLNGWLGMEKVPMNAWRTSGIIVLALGIIIVYLGKREAELSKRNDSGRLAVCAFASFAIGMVAAFQAPTNATLAQSVGYLEASFVNFVVAWAVVLVITLVRGKGRFASMKGVRTWETLGGVWGIIGVLSTALATSILGAGLMVAGGTFAQLGLSIVIDAKGWLGCPKVKMDPLRTVGVAVIAIGIILTAIGKIS